MEGDKDVPSWIRLSRQETQDYHIFKAVAVVHQEESCADSGRKGNFVVLEAPEWATVVPLLIRDGRPHFVMIKQYRHGSQAMSIEFPGGVSEAGEDIARCAARELEEETGYKALSLQYAGGVYPNPAFMNNRYHVYLAKDLIPTGLQSFDEHENIQLIILPVDEVRAKMGTGLFSHALMLSALFLTDKLLGKY